jgi:hypothetical protein
VFRDNASHICTDPSSGGIEEDFACSGGGSPDRGVGPGCRATFGNSSAEMAAENPIWGGARIADELRLKLGIRVSPTVGKYLADGRGPRRTPDPKHPWMTFVRNHAKGIVAYDFFVVVTPTFRVLYVSYLQSRSEDRHHARPGRRLCRQ